MRPLPPVRNLAEAVKEVIRNNIADKYTPGDFIGMTEDGNAVDLVTPCTQAIKSPTAMEALEKALKNHPNLLTIEDYVSRVGKRWGFDDKTVEHSQANVDWFNKLVGHKRYA